MNGAVREKLRRLARVPESRFPFVSVYLDTKNDGPYKRDQARIFLKNQIREAEAILDARDERESFARDAEKILRYLDQETHAESAPAGMAIFACAGQDLWETVVARRPFQSQFLVSNRPLIRQLAVLLDEYEAVCAVLVDTRSARIFEITMDEAVRETGVEHDVPRETKTPEYHGWGDLKYQRDVRGHMDDHFDDVSHHIERLMDTAGYRRFVLMGQESTIQNFRKRLPKRVADRVIATCATDKREPRDRIVARVQDIVALEEKRQERELIGLIRDQALSGNLGVFGLEAVLNALRKGQVYKLAVSDDLRARGWRCKSCKGLSTHLKKDACPYCASGTDVVELGDEIVKDALGLSAEIETVRNSAELTRMGKVGALLRFRD
jgi:peptide subunit release factor 1 (eRF1)